MNESIWAPKPSPSNNPQVRNHPSHLSTPTQPYSQGLQSPPPAPDADMQQPQQEPPPPADSFAQTGPEASLDLFDDAIPTADDEAMRIRSEDDLFSDDFTPAFEPVVERTATAHPLPASTTGTATGINAAARGRGDGGRGAPFLIQQNSLLYRRLSLPLFPRFIGHREEAWETLM